MIDGASLKLTDEQMDEIEKILPVGWAYGDRYSVGQWIGPEKYCQAAIALGGFLDPKNISITAIEMFMRFHKIPFKIAN